MNQQLLREELVRYEGCRLFVYLDTLGLKTAGIGHLLRANERDYEVGQPVFMAQVDSWYANDVIRSTLIAKSSIKNFSSLDDCRQRVLVQLAFNMGNRLLGFKNTLDFIEAGDYKRAADELQDSKWFGQVGKRGPETCYALRTGAYGWR